MHYRESVHRAKKYCSSDVQSINIIKALKKAFYQEAANSVNALISISNSPDYKRLMSSPEAPQMHYRESMHRAKKYCSSDVQSINIIEALKKVFYQEAVNALNALISISKIRQTTKG